MQIDIMSTVLASIQNEVDSKYKGIFANINGLTEEFAALLLNWQQTNKGLVQDNNPFAMYAGILKSWQQSNGSNTKERRRICEKRKSIRGNGSQKGKKIGNINNSEDYQCSIDELDTVGIDDLNQLVIDDYQNFSKYSRTPFDLNFWKKELLLEGSLASDFLSEKLFEKEVFFKNTLENTFKNTLENDFLIERPFKYRGKKKPRITNQLWLFDFEFGQDEENEEDEEEYKNKEQEDVEDKEDTEKEYKSDEKEEDKEEDNSKEEDNKDKDNNTEESEDSDEKNEEDSGSGEEEDSDGGDEDSDGGDEENNITEDKKNEPNNKGDSQGIGKPDINITRQLLLNDWQKNLDDAQYDWELEYLQQLGKEFLEKFKDWLDSLSILQKILENLGLEPSMWLNFSEEELKPEQIEQFKFWAEYLAQDAEAQAICKLLGSMTQIAKLNQLEKIKPSLTLAPYLNSSSKDEIVGLKLGNDIENVLPSELALLSDPDTAILFDLKYLEASLLCFNIEGVSLEPEQENNGKSNGENKKQGPMILCIDTSGSMYGEPEKIAKAMALFLATQAKEQKRECYLINFSVDIETYELTGKDGLSSLIKFLGNSFYDDTDIVPALQHTLLVMSQETYRKADVLVISDFVMDSLPDDILQGINRQRNSGNIFNSLVIGDYYIDESSHTYFDHEWIYNPKTSKIQELVAMVKL